MILPQFMHYYMPAHNYSCLINIAEQLLSRALELDKQNINYTKKDAVVMLHVFKKKL